MASVMVRYERRLWTAVFLLCLPLFTGGLRPGTTPSSEGSAGNSREVYVALRDFVEWSAQARPADLDERARHFNAVQIPLAAAALDEAERPLDTHDEATYRAMVRWQFWLAKHLDPENQGSWQASPSALASTHPVARQTTAVLPALEMLQLQSLAHMAWRRDHVFDALVWWRDRGLLGRRIARDLFDPSTGGYARYDSLGRRTQHPGNLADLLPLALDAPTDRGAALRLALQLLVGGKLAGPHDARASSLIHQALDPASGWPFQPGLDLLTPEQNALLLSRAVARLNYADLSTMTDDALRGMQLLSGSRMPLDLGQGWISVPLPASQTPLLERARVAIHFLGRALVLTPDETKDALLVLDSAQLDSIESADSLAAQLDSWADAWIELDPYERRKLQSRRHAKVKINGDEKTAAFGFRENDVSKWMPEAVDLLREDAQALRQMSRREASYGAEIVPEVVARDHRPSLRLRFHRLSAAERGTAGKWTGAWTNGLQILPATPLIIRNTDHLIAWATLPALPDAAGLWWLVVRGPEGAPRHSPACALVDPMVATVRPISGDESHHRRFEIRIDNRLIGELEGRFEVAAPESWEVYPEAARNFLVPSRSAIEWEIELNAPEGEAPGHYPVEWRFYDGIRMVAMLQDEFAVHFDWVRIGPFPAGRSGELAGRYPPENQIRIGEEYEGSQGPVEWRHLEPGSLKSDGWVELGHGEPGEIWYGLTAVSTTTRNARIRLESPRPSLIRVNGEEIGRTNPRRKKLDAGLNFTPGPNYLLVKAVVGPDGVARARVSLHDYAGAPLRTADYRLEHLVDGIAYLAGGKNEAITPERRERAEMRLVLVSYQAAGARSVSVVGNFNGWAPAENPMTLHEDGVWRTEVRLRPGEFQYKFVVDGTRWVPDPVNPNTVDDGFGAKNSVLVVR